MNPDDERVRRALHSLQPDGVDAPERFDRVARGARRRRRAAAGGAMFGAVAVVCAAAVVPAALGGNSHSSSGVQAASGDVDPGFTGVSPQPSAAVSPTQAPSAASTSVASSVASSVANVAPPTPWPTDTSGCPTINSLPPGANAEADARAAALAAAPDRYGAEGAKAVVTKVYPAASGQGFGIVADAICGKALGDNSYVVELGFGDRATANATNSASMGSGQLFVANFPGAGWQVWFQYH
jgi:hypothetical protein